MAGTRTMTRLGVVIFCSLAFCRLSDHAVTSRADAYFRPASLEIRSSGGFDKFYTRPADDGQPAIPKPVYKVSPVYPDILRQRGVQGRVTLAADIDERGNVLAVKVVKSLHPYLDYASVQAVRQWRFEPAIEKGKPVSAILTMEVNYDAEAYRKQDESLRKHSELSAAQGDLSKILSKCDEYCQALLASALDYICVEKINDVYWRMSTKEELDESGAVLAFVAGTGRVSILAPPFTGFRDKKRSYKKSYVSDYLLIKRGGRIEEKRAVVEDKANRSGSEMPEEEGKRFSVFVPFIAPVAFVGKARQPLFVHNLLQEDRINGKTAYVIEAQPISGDAGGTEYARIWVEKEHYRILKIENTGIPIDGYEGLLKEAAEYNIKPAFITTYLYEKESNGLAFPSRLTIRADYPSPFGNDAVVEKLRTTIRYSDYKYFYVETETDIEKTNKEIATQTARGEPARRDRRGFGRRGVD